MTLRRGESLLLTLGIPVGLLIFFSLVDVLPTTTDKPVTFLAPGIVALAVMSAAMVPAAPARLSGPASPAARPGQQQAKPLVAHSHRPPGRSPDEGGESAPMGVSSNTGWCSASATNRSTGSSWSE